MHIELAKNAFVA